jgi:hypothetical protein
MDGSRSMTLTLRTGTHGIGSGTFHEIKHKITTHNYI